EFRDGGEDRDLANRARALGYRLEYCPGAVVEHYFEEDPRVLVRRVLSRARRMYLRQVMTGALPRPTGSGFAGQLGRVAAVAARLLVLPEAVWKLRRQGVAAGDVFPFALFGWLDRTARRAGQAEMMLRILTGRQTVQRSTPGEGAPRARVRARPTHLPAARTGNAPAAARPAGRGAGSRCGARGC